MIRNRFLALLTALCLLFSTIPFHTHASHADPLQTLHHSRQRREATHRIQVGPQGQRLVSRNSQAVLPAGNDEFLVSNTLGTNCLWGIADDGFLYIQCDGEMPRLEAGQYPWSAYTDLFKAVYLASGTVADNAFAGCGNLQLVLLEDGVSSIGQNAFANCGNLKEFWFYGTAPSIAENAFTGTKTNMIYHFNDASFAPLYGQSFGGELFWSEWVDAVDSGMFGTVEWTVYEDMTLYLYGAYNAMQDQASPDAYPWHTWSDRITYVSCSGITHLGNLALAGFTSLAQVAFDSILESLGEGVFRDCTGLTLFFNGDAPELGQNTFTDEILSLEYPENNPTWTEDVINRLLGTRSEENELPRDDDSDTTLPDDTFDDDELPPVDIPPEPPVQVTCGITAQQVYDAMMALKPQYPEGMRWTNDDFYAWNGGVFSGGYGCAGFAFILSDAAFGTEPSRIIEEDITIEDIRAGDILRINNDTHSVIVLEVHNDHVVVAEGNYNSSIHWGRTFTAQQIASVTDYIMTRYPEHSWKSGSCLESRTCLVCGTQGEAPGHSWQEASCTAPKTCLVCRLTEGAAAGHTYDDDADSTCNVCGYQRETGDDTPAENIIPLSAFELEVLRLTNLERLAQGLTPLTATALLQQATDIRAEEVYAYFDHTRPNGTSCFTVLDELGISFRAAAENIAAGYRTPAAVVNGWMNSDGHRANILNPGLGHMGVGEISFAWVQLFTDAPAYTSIRVDVPKDAVILPGTSIDDMGLVAVLHSKNGDCWLPLSAAYCTGYDPNVGSSQTVTVTVLGVSCTFTLNPEGHTHNWVEATCETPRTCADCGKAEGAPLGHSWVNATCEKAKSCSVCGKTEGDPLTHSWAEATCEKAKTCGLCGKIEGTPLGHDWSSASCEIPGTCNRCGLSNGNALGHNWIDATCDKAKTCLSCGKAEGDPLGHSWQAATCEKAKTCTVCGITEGNPLGHNWQAATCEKAKTCAVCGITEGNPLGHNWQAATCSKPKTCSVCGKTESAVADHNWDAGVITREPTFGVDGEITFTCLSCGITRAEHILSPTDPFVKVEKTDTVASKYNFSYDVPKDGVTVLIFFSPFCGNSQYLMQNLNHCLWLENPMLNVVAVDCYSGDDSNLEAFRNTYTPNAGNRIRYLYAQSNAIAFDYYWTMDDGNSLTWPLVMIVTGSAQEPVIRFGATALLDYQKLKLTLDYVSPAFAGWDGTVHEHTWTPATCQAPKTCAECGATEGTTADHSWIYATCQAPQTCQVCGLTEGTANPHNWEYATCTAPQFCKECGLIEGGPLPHQWDDATCLVPKTCFNCGTTDGEPLPHIWEEATCLTAKTCSECGTVEGEPLPHVWEPADCLIPSICASCGQSQGEPLGHDWVEATCQHPKYCARCSDTEGTVAPHEFLDGYCVVCHLQEMMPGDADGNGKLTYNDALKVLRASVNLEPLSEDIAQACDVDGNGRLDYNDALLILRFSIGLITEFPKKR